MTTLYSTFDHYYLKSADTVVPKSSEEDNIELAQLICPILDFVGAVARGGKAKDWFNGGNESALVAAVFNYVQMTNEDVSFVHSCHISFSV